MNDILLEAPNHADHILVQAPVLNLQAHDLLIDSPERRKSNTPFRRALVHDESDGLTINFAGDYPGGVTLNAVAGITPKGDPGPIGALQSLPGLAVHGDILYEVAGIALVGGGRPRVTVSLTKEINSLHSLVDQLTARITALEKK